VGLKGIVKKVCNDAGNRHAIAETCKGDHFLPANFCTSRKPGEELPLQLKDEVLIESSSRLGSEHISTKWSIPPQKKRPAR
jgi:hypothetical protein